MELFDDSLREASKIPASLESSIIELLESESPRYLEQAKDFLSAGFLNIRCGKVSIKYKYSGDQFSYQYNDKRDGSLQESELLAPESYDDQIEILKFIFAQSEAEVSL